MPVITAYAAGLLAKGKANGITIGEERGRKSLTYEYVSEGDISPEKAGKRLGITVEELKRNMQLEGYTYPGKLALAVNRTKHISYIAYHYG